MYSAPFRLHRAGTLDEAIGLLADLGEDAKLLAGGQSLIPLMKLRLAAPTDLIDLNHIPGLSGMKLEEGVVACGPLLRHAAVAEADISRQIPILRDCASGIADVQVRGQGTMAGSVAEADPSGDWMPVLMALQARVSCRGRQGSRSIMIDDFVQGPYTTALDSDEIIERIEFNVPAAGSGGAYLAFKRSAQVYASAGAAVQMTLCDGVLQDVRIALSSVGLTTLRAFESERLLQGQAPEKALLKEASQAAGEASRPMSDQRGSADYKKALVTDLVERAALRALQRCRGESVEGGHDYI